VHCFGATGLECGSVVQWFGGSVVRRAPEISGSMQNSLLSTCASNNNNGSKKVSHCLPDFWLVDLFGPQFLGLIRQRREKDPRECFKKR